MSLHKTREVSCLSEAVVAMNLLSTPHRIVSALNCGKRKARVSELNDDAASVVFEKVLKIAGDGSSEAVLETDEVIFEKLEKLQIDDSVNGAVDEPSQPVVEIEISNRKHENPPLDVVATNPLNAANQPRVEIEVELEDSRPTACHADESKPSRHFDKMSECHKIDMMGHPGAKETQPTPSVSQATIKRQDEDMPPKIHAAQDNIPFHSDDLDSNVETTCEQNSDDLVGDRIAAPPVLLHPSFNKSVKKVTEELPSIPELVRFMSHVEGKEKGFEIVWNDFKSFLCCSADPKNSSGTAASTVVQKNGTNTNGESKCPDQANGSDDKPQETSSELDETSCQSGIRGDVRKMERSISRFSQQISIPSLPSSSRKAQKASDINTCNNVEKRDDDPVQRFGSRRFADNTYLPTYAGENEEEEVGRALSPDFHFSPKDSRTSMENEENTKKIKNSQLSESRLSRKGSRNNIRQGSASSIQRSGSLFSRKSVRVRSARDAESVEAAPTRLSGFLLSRKGSRTEGRKEKHDFVPSVSSGSHKDRCMSSQDAEGVGVLSVKLSRSLLPGKAKHLGSEDNEKSVPIQNHGSRLSRKGSRTKTKKDEGKEGTVSVQCSSKDSGVGPREEEMLQVAQLTNKHCSSHLSGKTSQASSRCCKEQRNMSSFVMSKAGLPPLENTYSSRSSSRLSALAFE